MANNNMTRAQAIEFAIDNIAANCMNDMENTGANEAIAVLEKMHAQITKPRKKAEGPSKARRDNERLAYAMRDAIAAHGSAVTPKWVTEHVSGIMSPQKAVAVAAVGVDLGLITKTKEGKATYYAVA